MFLTCLVTEKALYYFIHIEIKAAIFHLMDLFTVHSKRNSFLLQNVINNNLQSLHHIQKPNALRK